ncbi:MAG: hypothetical protein GY839_05215 [candidate division Zixibacteria bacterium]|nr:hypothetical protein [candidate division Zixibacteria bacterium]
MLSKLITITVVFLISVGGSNLYSQTCSCAGPPLLSSVEFRPTPAKTWQFGLTVQHNSLSRLVTVSETLEDDARARSTQAVLIEAGYGINQRLSFTSVFSLIQKRRTITLPAVGQDKLLTRGLGDAVFMLKYNLLPRDFVLSRQLTVGGGVKAPLGRSNLRLDEILIATDMQPGTGSIDGLLWGNYTQRFHATSPVSINLSASFSFAGENDNQYKFGNDFESSAGFYYEAKSRVDFSAALKYRWASPDTRFSTSEIPNTGGQWFRIEGGLNLKVNNSLTSRFSIQLPVYQKVEGTQLTTSYTLSVSMFYARGLTF